MLQDYFYKVAAQQIGVDWEVIMHFNHCVDYLRQTLLCHADTTLEGQDPTQQLRPDSSGLGVEHTCRNY